MAAKKKKLQIDLETEAGFKEFLSKDGLKVIDAYASWCGPCKAAIPLFKTLKVELADDFLHFATANTDKIETLQSFNGTSRPTFLFYGGDVLVRAQLGANGPKLSEAITTELQTEHDALDGKCDRIKFDLDTLAPSRPVSSRHRTASARLSSSLAASRRPSAAQQKQRSFTLALIKPDAYANGHTDSIFAKIAEHNIKIVQHIDPLTMSEEKVKAFYDEHKDQEFFDALVQFMSSGPLISIVLASHDDVISKWRSLIGPANVEEAREDAPESMRALFGTDNIANAVHGSDSKLSAYREIEFFFPEWALENLDPDRLILIITPDATQHRDAIVTDIERAGFLTLDEREMELTEEQCLNCFQHPTDEFIAFVTSAPSVVLLLSRVRGLDLFPAMVGVGDLAQLKQDNPECIRAKYGEDDLKIGAWHPSGENENERVAKILLDDPDELEVVDEHLQGAPNDQAADDTSKSATDEGNENGTSSTEVDTKTNESNTQDDKVEGAISNSLESASSDKQSQETESKERSGAVADHESTLDSHVTDTPAAEDTTGRVTPTADENPPPATQQEEQEEQEGEPNQSPEKIPDQTEQADEVEKQPSKSGDDDQPADNNVNDDRKAVTESEADGNNISKDTVEAEKQEGETLSASEDTVVPGDKSAQVKEDCTSEAGSKNSTGVVVADVTQDSSTS